MNDIYLYWNIMKKRIVFLSSLVIMITIMFFSINVSTQDFNYQRYSTYTITNSSTPYIYNYDYFNVYDYFGYTHEDLIDNGYEGIEVFMTLDVTEVIECDMNVYVFNHYNNAFDQSDKKNYYYKHTIEGDFEKNIPETVRFRFFLTLDQMNESFCIKYGAYKKNWFGGSAAAEWVNSNCFMEVSLRTSLDAGFFVQTSVN